MEFQFEPVFNLEFQPKSGIQLGIPISMGINLGECILPLSYQALSQKKKKRKEKRLEVKLFIAEFHLPRSLAKQGDNAHGCISSLTPSALSHHHLIYNLEMVCGVRSESPDKRTDGR